MLEKLNLKNFRCFRDYTIEFDKFNIIVGKNNTGKSTIIDALKLISNVRRYAPYRKYLYSEDADARVCLLEERDIPFSLTNLRYNYTDDNVFIHSKFSSNSEIKITFPLHDKPYAHFLRDGQDISTKESLKNFFPHSLGIIPPVGTFEDSESLGDLEYIRSVSVSHLTPRHFRNIWYFFKDGFEEFEGMITETWPECIIEPPEFDMIENRITMFFREKGITREIFWAGHGFQVWLQLITFLVKLGRMDSLILDEPDIYLHSDMQKKLVNICKERSNQVIIATHAVDIIEEVEPDEIISIDKMSTKSKRLSNIDEVQTCINQLGSFQNLKLVHFTRGKACLFVEGNDFKYLKIIARKLNLNSFASEDGFSIIPLEGFSNWDRLLHIDWIFTNAFGERVKCYVILDRDYYTEQEIEEIISQLGKKNVKVHVWARKEIENYLIDNNILYGLYCKRCGSLTAPLSAIEFNKKIESLFEDLRNDVQSQIIARRIRNRPRATDESTIVSQVLKEFERDWKNANYRKNVISGKEFFARLNEWLNSEYNFTISVGYAFNSLKSDEIGLEVSAVLNEFIDLVKR